MRKGGVGREKGRGDEAPEWRRVGVVRETGFVMLFDVSEACLVRHVTSCAYWDSLVTSNRI